MNASRSPLRRIARLTALAVVALAMAGCSKKMAVDPSFTTPEGVQDANARLIVYPDVPITYQVWDDRVPEGGNPQVPGDPGVEDVLLSTNTITVRPGAQYGVIMDGTPATAYQAMRREGNGGMAQLNDYLLTPSVRFLDSQWELYRFQDLSPSGFTPPTYLGRGLVAGQVTRTSPLTNLGEQLLSRPADLVYTGEQVPRDSNFTLKWQGVPGAVGYWVQIYQYRGGAEQQLLASQPAPFVVDEARNYYVAYIPAGAAPVDTFNIKSDPGATVLTRRTILTNVEYLVRMSAVNDRGEMIAFTPGSWEIIRSTGTFRRYQIGAIKVRPKLQ